MSLLSIEISITWQVAGTRILLLLLFCTNFYTEIKTADHNRPTLT